MASAESWANDAKARQAMQAACGLPDPAARHALSYLALFRPCTGRGLSWGRALRLIGELAEQSGTFRRVSGPQGEPERIDRKVLREIREKSRRKRQGE